VRGLSCFKRERESSRDRFVYAEDPAAQEYTGQFVFVYTHALSHAIVVSCALETGREQQAIVSCAFAMGAHCAAFFNRE